MKSIFLQSVVDSPLKREVYVRPSLISYGSVTVLTKGGGATGLENVTGNNPITCSQNKEKSCNAQHVGFKRDIALDGYHVSGL